ncbi:malonate--CoA ligase [Salipiger mucosus]|uniref:Long-chain-fatty-acid--CoA ligase n=1 Tax=Salipiger mucosus DSM 16094 TaxID=1123237 RepID=S9Q5X3_9RHOB|nr:malonyl-CoA synthase [Salipiger mucosus]EPX75447.1 Long-chain-fatty-acid--CoA ligase [Salipiger mucosus DSM 16094]
MANPLYDALFAPHAGKSKDVIIRSDGSRLSYEGFLAMAARMAHVLTEQGLAPGDRLAVQVTKSPEALALYAAAVQAGVIFLPLNTAYTTAELDYFVGDSGATLLVCDSAREPDLRPMAEGHGAQTLTLDADGAGSLTTRAAGKSEHFETVPRSPDDLAAFLYTSGTTGRSKGAMLTQDNLLSNALTLVEAWRFTGDDVLLHALPIFHTHGLFVATNVVLATGGTMIFLPGFDLDRVLAALPQATAMMGVPTFYTRLLDDPRFTRELAGHMRLFTSGSAPLLAATHEAFEQRTGHRILERYGMTETNMSTSNPYEGDRRAGTVGPPLPGVELKITDPETGRPVAQGEVGVIEVRGPNVFQGYWRMPEKTAEELRPDGFFITGDLATQDAEGYVTIVGRAKDLVISGGYNIYPKELEEVLDAQPGVRESAVVGVPHPDLGEAALALLVPEPGAAPDLPAIEAALGQRLARYKHPRRIELIDELPRNTMGKVQKALLRERYGQAFTAPAK